MSRWFRWYEGTTEDGKFRVVARNAGVTVRDAIALWAFMLEDASSDDHRGVCRRNEDFMAAILDFEDGVVESILAAMEAVDMISVGHGAITICHWRERQFETDRVDGTNAERQKRWREKQKQNATADTTAQPRNGTVTSQKTETETEYTSSLRSDVRPPGPETEMLDAYNEAARQVGWPTAGKLTQPRKTSLARIAGDIGAEGWRNAMARARASPFLTGKAGRRDGHENWRPDLDFFLRPKTLTKLLEGSYDGAPGGGRQAADRPHDTVFRALASVVEKRARNGGGASDPHGRPEDDGGAEEADILLPPSHHRPAFSAAR